MNISLTLFSRLWGMLVLLLKVLVIAEGRGKDLCQSELKPDLKSLIEFTVADKEELDLKAFKIVLKEGDNFNNILTPECDPRNFPLLSVEFREEGTDDWYQSNIADISDHKYYHKRSNAKLWAKKKSGKIKLRNIELDYCKVYEMRLKVNEKSGEEIIKVGPFKDLFTPEELVNLNEEQLEEKEINLTYEKTEKGVRVSWNDVCGESIKIYVKVGMEDTKYLHTMKGQSENSFIMETKPCNIYMFELDFFLSPDPAPEKKIFFKYGSVYKGINRFITPPEPETFANIRMDKSSKILSWDLSEYRGFSNDPQKTLCIQKNDLKYKITFGTIDGQELVVLQESNSPRIDRPETFDVLQAITNEIAGELEKCHGYQVKMEVSYRTAMGKSLSRVFTKLINTNNLGRFVELEDVTEMTMHNNELNIKLGSCTKHAKVVLVDMGDNSITSRYGSVNHASVQPRIISSKDVIEVSTKINMTKLKVDDLKPCVAYSIQLIRQGQENKLVQAILAGNNTIFNLAKPIDMDIRAPLNKPILKLEGDNLKIEESEENSRCKKQVYKVKCWPNSENESFAEETIHPPHDINIEEYNFADRSNYTCRAKIQYQVQAGNQTYFEESDWSNALSITAQNPLNEIEEHRQEPAVLSPVLRLLLCQYFSKASLSLEDNVLNVKAIQKNNMCNRESYKIKCWNTGENESFAKESIHTSANINIKLFNFTEGSEYSCRIKMDYKAQEEDLELLETGWSEPITFVAPGQI